MIIPGLFAGIRPGANPSEVSVFDLGLFSRADQESTNDIFPASGGMRTPPPLAPKLLPAAIQQNPMHMVLPLARIPGDVVVGPPVWATDTEGMYPKPGVGRHEKPGLAYLVEKPNNLPLMPRASNYFPFGPSPLGQPA